MSKCGLFIYDFVRHRLHLNYQRTNCSKINQTFHMTYNKGCYQRVCYLHFRQCDWLPRMHYGASAQETAP